MVSLSGLNSKLMSPSLRDCGEHPSRSVGFRLQNYSLNRSQASGQPFKLCKPIFPVQYWSTSRPIASPRVCGPRGPSGRAEVGLVMFATALEEAQQLDEEYKATGKLRGPLHGVPISFKDQIEIAGKDASIGFSRSVGASGLQIAILTCLFQLVPKPV